MRPALEIPTLSIRAVRSARLRPLLLLGTCLAAAYVTGCAAEEPPTTPPETNGGTGVGGSAGKGAGGSAGGGSGGAASGSGGTGVQGGSAGSTTTGGTGGASAGTGALAGSGGSTGGSAGAGATGSGGAGNAGMGGASGGTAGTGGSGGRVGSAGSGAAGAGAGSGSGGSGGNVGTPKPSAGCGKSGRPSGGKVEVANTSLHMFPESYDGTKPFPLLIALHACGNANTEFVSHTNGVGFAAEYVRTFPNTPDSGQCWSNYSGDVSRVKGQFDELLNNYCIDENRVFAIAHSSGAQLLVNIVAHKTDADHFNLKGISPVAADPFNVALPMPVLYIDGVMDNQRSANSAKDTVAKFRASNGCAETSTTYAPVMACNSTESSHVAVDPGCKIYDGCSVPTIWCAHNDPNYSGTQHGVPCFALKSMYDFFASL